MVGKSPYRPQSPFPIAVVFLAILLFVVGAFATCEIVARTFAQELGMSSPAVVGVSAQAAWVDPRRAVPALWRYTWHCYGLAVPKPPPLVAPGAQPTNPPRCPVEETTALSALIKTFGIGIGASVASAYVPLFITAMVLGAQANRKIRRRVPPAPEIDPAMPLELRPFVLHVGKSTGMLVDRGHGAGITPNQDVVLVHDDASQNIVIYGSIGSGKTTSGINRLVMQALRQACGMLVFDVKAEYGRTLKALAATIGRPVTTIGVGGRPLNLLAGLTPEVAASFLKSAFILAGSASNAIIYLETATNLARNTLGMLSYFPDQYSLRGLYDAVFDKDL